MFDISNREQSSPLSLSLSLSLSFQQQSLSRETMDPTLVSGTRFESQFQICVYEHAILRIYISFFSNNVSFTSGFFASNGYILRVGMGFHRFGS